MQLKASYFLEGVKANLKNHFKGEVLLGAGNEYTANWKEVLDTLDPDIKRELEQKLQEKQNQFDGLLNWLSWFNINHELAIPENPNPILSVINNLISRGEFTKPSLNIEAHFARAFGRTKKLDTTETGNLGYILKDKYKSKDFLASVWDTLHIIDTEAEVSANVQFSKFEAWFLCDRIKDENSFLRQLLQRQRELTTICLSEQGIGFKGNRVDFSIEFPYFQDDEIQRFHSTPNFKIKRRHGLVIEIDGEPYHTLAPQIIHDGNRDEAIRLANWKVSRVTSAMQVEQANNAIAELLEEPFIQATRSNLLVTEEERIRLTQLVLSPIAIARVQKTIVRYLISKGEAIINSEEFKVGIIERDVPCGYLAVEDLNELIDNICLLKGENKLPNIKATIFSDTGYSQSPLHNEKPLSTSALDLGKNDFDLLIDISVLKREGIFLDDNKFLPDKTILIRSVHYVEAKNESIICSDLIEYKQIVEQHKDGTYKVKPEGEERLKYFLQNIFRKQNFREGQLPILSRALQLKSVIGLLPTGGGKSLTYQLAALLQPGITLVIDPIRSLMLDQYKNLVKSGIESCNFINSSLNISEKIINIASFERGEAQFCFISPERLVMQEFRDVLKECGRNNKLFAYCVIDEVHCVSEWGHDFRTPYLSLGKNARKHCPTFSWKYGDNKFKLPLFGLTATASFDVLADVERELEILETEIDDTIVSFENTLRDEIQYQIIKTDIDFPPQQILGLDIWLNPNLKGNNNWWSRINALDAQNNVIADIPLKDEIGKRKQGEIQKILQHTFLETFKYYTERENLESLLQKSYKEFLDEKQKEAFEKAVEYVNHKIKKIIPNIVPDVNNLWANCSNGFIVFVPHRTGTLGVSEVFGMIDGIPKGFFMGSDDDDAAVNQLIQQQSFENQERFINNEIAVIVATKAFGMGIDKPNIRATIHINMPSSLESFVQESGRAGRDGKLAISFLLYNENIFKFLDKKSYRNLFSGNTIHGYERKRVQLSDVQICMQLNKITNGTLGESLNDGFRYLKNDFETRLNNIQEPIFNEKLPSGDITHREKLKIAAREQWVDFDVLAYFHNNSFKGIVKELVILDELLDEISFPMMPMIELISAQFYEETKIAITLKWGGAAYADNLWVNDKETGNGYGWIDTVNFNCHHHAKGGFNKTDALKIITQLKEFILNCLDFKNLPNHDERRVLLKGMKKISGLINAIDYKYICLDFKLKNRYHPNRDKKSGQFIIANFPVIPTPWMERMLQTLKNNFPEFQGLTDGTIQQELLGINLNDGGYQNEVQTVDELWSNIERYYQNFHGLDDIKLLHEDRNREKVLEKAFYCDRNSADTHRAVYRLLSIGIIDDYTIDYRTNTIKLFFSRKSTNDYIDNLRRFILRYYSQVQTQSWIDKLSINDANDRGIVIEECLRVLVEFVYNETEAKRFQGIKEMVEAIRQGLPKKEEEELIEGNQRFKEEIYYYFNAKYAKRRNLTIDGRSASLLEDTDNGKISSFWICKKYLKILAEEQSSYLSNLKHLRAATQKILRTVNQKNGCLKILKGYALYQLSQQQPYFENEALGDSNSSGLIVEGFTDLIRENRFPTFRDLDFALSIFEMHCLNKYPEHILNDKLYFRKRQIHIIYYNFWLSDFLNNFTN